MRYIETLHEGETIRNTYLCKGKRSAETRNGKPYDNLILQDKMERSGIRIQMELQITAKKILLKFTGRSSAITAIFR